MTDHSIEELQRQYDNAKSRRVQAQGFEAKARERLRDAKAAKLLDEYAAQGIVPGCKVRVTSKWWPSSEDTEIYGFHGVVYHSRWGDDPEPDFVVVKKDGTIGKRRVNPCGEIIRMELAE